MQSVDTPRETLALLVARHLVIGRGAEMEDSSPVKIALAKLTDLVDRRQIPASQHQQLLYLLQSLEGCDLDHCDRTSEIVNRVAMSVALWPEEFPDHELERLRDILYEAPEGL